ncbi:MAG: hypothetical protein V9E96_19005 [Chitinophagaceae bacterium]
MQTPLYTLSKHQLLIYQLLQQGYTEQQIVIITKLSVLTVSLTIKKLKKKGY